MQQKKTTDELLKALKDINSTSELDIFTKETYLKTPAESFHKYITNCIRNSKMSQSQIIQKSQLQRNYAYQILNGTKKPGRDKVIALCLAMSMDLKGVQKALTLANEGALYPKLKRDSIIIFAINKTLSVLDTNELLYDMGEEILK